MLGTSHTASHRIAIRVCGFDAGHRRRNLDQWEARADRQEGRRGADLLLALSRCGDKATEDRTQKGQPGVQASPPPPKKKKNAADLLTCRRLSEYWAIHRHRHTWAVRKKEGKKKEKSTLFRDTSGKMLLCCWGGGGEVMRGGATQDEQQRPTISYW